MKRILLLAAFISAMTLQASALNGDVNGDGEVTVSDINAVIEVILGSSSNSAADVNGDGEITVGDVNFIINIIIYGSDDDELTPKEIELDFSALDEPSELIPDDEDAPDYGDYVENTTWSTTVRITFDGETATVTGNPSSVIVNIDGAHLTFTSAAKRVRYIVTGSTANGSLKF